MALLGDGRGAETDRSLPETRPAPVNDNDATSVFPERCSAQTANAASPIRLTTAVHAAYSRLT
jgi:hypothetical protein